ncbi:MAG: hypothetical protein AMXMBFR13_07190 [Phycisphaerae bacterium]
MARDKLSRILALSVVLAALSGAPHAAQAQEPGEADSREITLFFNDLLELEAISREVTVFAPLAEEVAEAISREVVVHAASTEKEVIVSREVVAHYLPPVEPNVIVSREVSVFKTFQIMSAASRKVHGGRGSFDIPLPLGAAASSAGVECRTGGPTQIVFKFNGRVKAIDGTLDANEVQVTGATLGTVTAAGEQMFVELSGVADATCIHIRLGGIEDLNGVAFVGDDDVAIRTLLGDVNNDGQTASGDITQVKSVSGQVTSATNFRRDVNADGQVASGDITQVKSRSGRSVICR